MSKYKVGDKVVLTITDTNEMGCLPCYVLNDDLILSRQEIDKYSEPLSTYTEPLEDTIQKHTVKIARLVMEKEGLKNENERLKAENEKMSIKIDAYELCGDQHEEEYNQAFNQGAKAAWELAKKIILPQSQDGMSIDDYVAIFGSCISEVYIMKNYTYTEAAAKVAEWEKAKEEIKVGDILEDIADNNVKCVVIKPYSSNMAYLIFSDGSAGLNELDNLRKTGKHTDIDSFLKQIKGTE